MTPAEKNAYLEQGKEEPQVQQKRAPTKMVAANISFKKTSKKVDVAEKPVAPSVPPPKKASNSYIHFKQATIQKIVDEEKLSFQEAFTKCGEMWGKMTEEDKKPW